VVQFQFVRYHYLTRAQAGLWQAVLQGYSIVAGWVEFEILKNHKLEEYFVDKKVTIQDYTVFDAREKTKVARSLHSFFYHFPKKSSWYP
jgi:hypothetical protein